MFLFCNHFSSLFFNHRSFFVHTYSKILTIYKCHSRCNLLFNIFIIITTKEFEPIAPYLTCLVHEHIYGKNPNNKIMKSNMIVHHPFIPSSYKRETFWSNVFIELHSQLKHTVSQSSIEGSSNKDAINNI